MPPAVDKSAVTSSKPNSSKETPPRLDLFDAVTAATPPDRSLHMAIADLITQFTDYPKLNVDPETGYVMTTEQVTVDMPVELKVAVNPNGTVKNLKGSPPTQLVKTTIMPVFHHMRLRIVREDGE
jgi:hypothetical protein